MTVSPEIRTWLEAETGIVLRPGSERPAGGGCIHEGCLAGSTTGQLVFLKRNRADRIDLFEGERRSLDFLRGTNAVRVPTPYRLGTVGGDAVFAMEGIELHPLNDAASQERLGCELAELHDHVSPEGKFGAPADNHIGATPQPNPWTDSWADFFVTHRLGHQFDLAAGRGFEPAETGDLLETVHRHLATLTVSPSLLHGDLWGGNAARDETGAPVLFDPAAYFGDRETDLAFTKMFGGFGPPFYAAYRDRHPEPEPVREAIYNLYHQLNHYNLFGGGYAIQASATIRLILRKL